MTTLAATEVDLAAVDLADPAVWDDGPPYELFARMQREDPVHYSPQRNVPGEGGFWSITRFDDVRTVSRDHRTFSSEKRGIFNVDDIGVPLDVQRLQLISMDPPRHDRLKAHRPSVPHQGARRSTDHARQEVALWSQSIGVRITLCKAA